MRDNLEGIWQDVLKIIEDEIMAPVSFKTWFLPIRPEKIADRKLTLSVPNKMIREIIEQKYMDLLKNSVAHITRQDLAIDIIIGDLPDSELSVEEKKSKEEARPQKPTAANANGNGNGSDAGNLNPKYTFETFVIGNSNRFAHAACLAVADSPNETYNPLFIYGGVGLGKTHLMHAIGHRIKEKNRNARVVYVSSEKFMNEMIHSIQNNSNEAFREKYRKNVDVILIDDIQFIAGKESTQQELFHTFNELKDSNKQIILSSDRPPNEIPTLEDRLRTRFASGLIADIEAPDFETRVAILKKKAEADKISVPDDILIYIATKIKSNIRELEGALIRVMAYARLTDEAITVDLATEALKDLVSESRNRELSVELIQEVVANYYNLSVDDLKGQRRTRNVAMPRQIAMYLSRTLTSTSLPKIGEEFNKDHTTVMHAYTKIHEALASDSALKTTVDNITKKLSN
ncbi:chromosomal replication initiator protein DnaA [Clostridiaceae bacterium HFYG-1003]|nr:chromosomal replication initiator protein DnaA [Clostridiaceae bacterium HFYG-1003]